MNVQYSAAWKNSWRHKIGQFEILSVVLESACIAALVSVRFLPVLVLLIPLAILTSLAILIDAVRCGFYPRHPMRITPAVRVMAAIALLPVAYFFKPAVFAGLYVRDACVEAMRMSGGAMIPCLQPGDRILVNKLEPWRRWDIVPFPHPENGQSPIAQRIAGLPGETVEIIDGTVTIDGKPLNPPPGLSPYMNMLYLGRLSLSLRGLPGAGCTSHPIKLGSDEYYLLGDNTSRSLDSRLWERSIYNRQLGAVPADGIIGRVTAIYWPPSRWRVFRRVDLSQSESYQPEDATSETPSDPTH